MFPARRSIDCPKYDKLVEKKKTKSPVWEHFRLPANEKGQVLTTDIAICIVCKSPVSAKGGSTTNLTGHVKVYHPLLYTQIHHGNKNIQVPSSSHATNENEEDPDNPEPDISQRESSCKILKSGHSSESSPKKKQKTMLDFKPLDGKSMKECTESVTHFIVGDLQPYSIVESEPFKNMIKTLNPRYKMPGRKFFSKTAIPKLYNETVDKIKKEMSSIKISDIAITTDCWTSLANEPYITITAHFIDIEWNLKSFCLSCTHFQEDHIAENIGDVLTDTLSDWNLDLANLSYCTTDNGPNIVKAINLLNVPHMPCFGHTINIGINKALKIPVLNRAVARLRKLQNTIAHSWKMARDFKEAQEFLQMDVTSLPSACVTRWWSISKLCRRFLKNQLPLCKLLQAHPDKKHLMLENNEVKAIEEFTITTNLLEEMTTNLSGEKYTTVSSVLPLLKKIKQYLQISESDSNLQKEIKKDILSSLQRYETIELIKLLRISSFCDPRFRLNYVENGDETKKIALEKIAQDYTECPKPPNHEAAIKKPKIGLEKLLEDDEAEETEDESLYNLLPSKKAEMECQHYLSMPKVGLNDKPLTWWKLNEHNFPVIKKLAKKYLAIQGSSVPSERVFSTSGNIITKNRASLLPKNAEMLVFLFQNKNII